jgi:hypothetical protein
MIWAAYKKRPLWARGGIALFMGAIIFSAFGSFAQFQSARVENNHARILAIQYAPPPYVSSDCSAGSFQGRDFAPNCPKTYNFAPQQRHINEQLKNNILTQIQKDKPITVFCAVGNDEECVFAHEIYDFFKSEGYKMTDTGPGQAVSNQPLKGLAYDPSNGTFRVGSQ